MEVRKVILRDVRHGARASTLRLLAPLRYLSIRHREKDIYDLWVPLFVAAVCATVYVLFVPSIPLFGETGLLRFVRDFLIMAIPFMFGALATVSVASQSAALDERPVGAELILDGQVLTLRQFVCYLLGYLCFVSLFTLLSVVVAGLLRDVVVSWLATHASLRVPVRVAGATALFAMLSALGVTVLWALYFLTEVVNRRAH